jgi:hypothetical protein
MGLIIGVMSLQHSLKIWQQRIFRSKQIVKCDVQTVLMVANYDHHGDERLRDQFGNAVQVSACITRLRACCIFVEVQARIDSWENALVHPVGIPNTQHSVIFLDG